MIFSASTYAELPISSTHSMFLTQNGEEYDIDLFIRPEVDVSLNIENFEENMVIVEVALKITKGTDITLKKGIEG